MRNYAKNASPRTARRVLAGLLCAVLLFGLIPATLPGGTAQAASWAQKYVETLASWGIMEGSSGDLAPDRTITRAELVALINRAYGYTQVGPTPFTDISPTNWYYDDIRIAYNVGYLEGTSSTTASPMLPVTREQALVLLGRNLMLQSVPGEVTGFTDGRDLSSWSRGYLQPAVEAGFIEGNSDGSFAPQRNITRGEVACMLVKALGTPINTPGEVTLGSVYGNVTISTSGVTLRNTVIAGDLYLTGGIGLGDVLLENVTVLGKIVDSGAGESEKGQSSIILRNVTADSMVVDSIANHFVTLRAEGNTLINSVSVRTSSYLEDATPNSAGLRLITLDGENGLSLQLAGNIKEVVNRTPQSTLTFAQGVADTVTVDEKAVGSGVSIANGASVGKLNLDVAAVVAGQGDIDELIVSASGATVAMLPDKITVRPGVTANIAGESMDNVTAAESSAEPRMLASYPTIRDIAPTTATAVFSTNKRGTIYWAITGLADGSASEEDVISPPTYATTILASGSISATSSQTEYSAKLTKLTSDGSYYLTTVMVDSRGEHSPVKVIAFSTPDDTTPAFNTGYPVMSQVTADSAQVTVMANKSCQLYYALLPRGSATPRTTDFKAAAITGNLGYGSVNALKNTTIPIDVNSVDLDELTNYDLFLWLTDYNGAKSSSVTKLSFTTTDGTPPVVSNIRQTDAGATSASIAYTVSEPCTLYWAVVIEGDPFLRPVTGSDVAPEVTDLAAKVQVESGVGAVKKGSSNAAKADTEYTFNITGLTSEVTYDLYYVAKDKAGNYSVSVMTLTPVNTLDTNAPTVTQEFDPYNGDNENEPLANSNVRLVFSESVQGYYTEAGQRKYHIFYELYQDVLNADRGSDAETAARQKLSDALQAHITMYVVPSVGAPRAAVVRTWDPSDEEHKNDDWVIDYRYATVTLEDGKMIITFPSTDNLAISALNMDSGATYYFALNEIADTAMVPNRMNNQSLPQFRTAFAQVAVNVSNTPLITGVSGTGAPTIPADKEGLRIDFNFVLNPTSVDRVEETMLWDMLIWTDTSITYELYSRPAGATDGNGWEYLGNKTIIVSNTTDGFAYSSMVMEFMSSSINNLKFESVRDMEDTEYAIRVTAIGDSADSTAWNQRVTVKIMVVAGDRYGLSNLASGSYIEDWEDAQAIDGVSSIGTPDPRTLYKQFTDTEAPKFVSNYPSIVAGDIAAEIEVMLDRAGQVYYVAVPLTNMTAGSTTISSGPSSAKLEEDTILTVDKYTCAVLPTTQSGGLNNLVAGGNPPPKNVPINGGPAVNNKEGDPVTRLFLSSPGISTITNGRFTGDVRFGSTSAMAAEVATTLTINNLTPNTVYYVYLVTKGTSAIYADYAECYRFTTKEAVRPTINLSASGTTINATVDMTTELTYFLALNGSEGADFQEDFWTAGIATLTAAPSGYTAVKTVLQAMATPYYDSGNNYTGSVFDEYATEQAKNTYASLIRSQSVSGNQIVMPSTTKMITVDAGASSKLEQIPCTGMTAGNFYTFIAVGKSTMGSGDAFRAYYPVRMSDTTPPMVVSAIIAVEEWNATTPNKIDKGTVTLVFSEGLYSLVSTSATTQTRLPVDNCKQGTHTGTDADGNKLSDMFVPVSSLVSSGAGSGVVISGTVDSHSNAKYPITTIELNISNVQNGFGISFENTITDEAGNGLNRSPLVVTVNVTQDGTDRDDNPVYVASLNVTASWDARP